MRPGRLGFCRVRFSALGGNGERLLSWCMARQIQITGVRAQPGGFTAVLRAADYRRLHLPARHCGVHLRVLERRGPGFRLRGLQKRPGLLLGPLVFLLTLQIASRLLWSVAYVDIPAAQRPALRATLLENGVREGTRLTEQQLAQAQSQLLRSRGTWFSLNFQAGRLVVEALPVDRAEIEQDHDVPLVAAADARILETNVESGFLVRKPGQTVSAGEVLVSTSRPDRSGTLIYQPTRGSVTALVEKTYVCVQPRSFTANLLTGRLETRCTLCLPWGEMALPAAQTAFAQYDTKERCTPLTFLGFALPGALRQETRAERQDTVLALSGRAAEERALLACLSQLYAEFPDAAIMTRSVQNEQREDSVLCTLTVQFCADIARPQKANESE